LVLVIELVNDKKKEWIQIEALLGNLKVENKVGAI